MNIKMDLELRKKLLEKKANALYEDIFHVGYAISETILTNALVGTKKEIEKIEMELKNVEKVEHINIVGQISELIYNANHPEDQE